MAKQRRQPTTNRFQNYYLLHCRYANTAQPSPTSQRGWDGLLVLLLPLPERESLIAFTMHSGRVTNVIYSTRLPTSRANTNFTFCVYSTQRWDDIYIYKYIGLWVPVGGLPSVCRALAQWLRLFVVYTKAIRAISQFAECPTWGGTIRYY